MLQGQVEVGEAYLSAAGAPGDPVVIDAYRRLQTQTDRMFHSLLGDEGPAPVRVVFTRCPDPYASDRELIEAVRLSGVLEITTAAINAGRIHPLLGCEYGGAFDRFRAVHDFIGHARTGFGFGLDDELAAWAIQDRLHGGAAGLALATELLAVNCARVILGETPEHKAVLLEPGLVRRCRAAAKKWPSGEVPATRIGPS